MYQENLFTPWFMDEIIIGPIHTVMQRRNLCKVLSCQVSTSAVVPIVCSAEPKGSTTSSHGIHGCMSVMATLKCTFFFIKGIMFC
jgi:hypothetical protein